MTDAATPSVRRAELVRVLLGAAVLGVLVGIAWAFLTPTPQARVLGDGTAVVPGAQIDHYFDGIGVFSMLMLGVGVIVGLVCWWGARSWRGPVGAIVAIVGAVVAGGFAIALGTWVLDLRLSDRAGLHPGDTFGVAPNIWLNAEVPGAVSAPGLLLVIAPLLATFVYLCAVLMSRSPDLGTSVVSAGEPTSTPAPA
ncbi:DUF2567 domain-containing protein [Gordonia sp. CPCC 205333]|uniref:DUF2567 domain-containing protein n=1 Tax=Gordonia sp. CPCC 205333 TaxID=3140790 RepID=UPI003AF3C3B4